MVSLTVLGLVSCSSDNTSVELNNDISQNEKAQAKGTLDKEDFFKSAIFFRGNMINNSSSTLLTSYRNNLESKYDGDMAKYDDYISYMCNKLLINHPNLYNNFYDVIESEDFFESKKFYENLSANMQTIFFEDPEFSDIKTTIQSITENVDFTQSNLKDLNYNDPNDLVIFQQILKDEYNIDLNALHDRFDFLPVYQVLYASNYAKNFWVDPDPVYFYNPGVYLGYVLPKINESTSFNMYILEINSLL